MHRFLLALLAAATLVVTGNAWAQSWPTRPIRFIVPLAPGGAVDLLARQLGRHVTNSWGQSVIIENRPGAGTVVGTEVAARAAPDGYTYLFVISSHLANPSLYEKLPYDTVRDFAPVSLLVTGPLVVVVNQSVPTTTLRDLAAWSKANPGKLSYATGSTADVGHLTGERMKLAFGFQMTHIPYKGASAAMNDLLAGHINMMINTISALLPHIRSGKLRALGVTTAARSETLPDVPSIAESFNEPTFDMSTFYGVLAPAGTPQEMIVKINAQLNRIIKLSEVRDSLVAQGFKPVGSSPDELGAYIESGVARSAAVVKAAAIRPE
jgi:tripartite-type tricarboxylate transporter receptor subunit TctC